ncbi:MAG: sigma-70 family RNA polymerase sigma factor [Kiritimatiellaeota bacterium]|nr:sigma-70 family RNA polymerase sigma factor [Kiritimatiellota bacterium]
MKFSTREQQELLARARQGDVDAFAVLFEAMRPLMHRVAYRLVGPNDCDDVVMETYIKAWRALSEFGGRSTLATWTCRIARNCAYDLLRRRGRREVREQSLDEPLEEGRDRSEEVPDPRARTPAEAAAADDLRGAIQAALDRLHEVHRTTFLLREVDGLSYREIAAATGVRIGTVMSRLFYARRRLRRLLEQIGAVR